MRFHLRDIVPLVADFRGDNEIPGLKCVFERNSHLLFSFVNFVHLLCRMTLDPMVARRKILPDIIEFAIFSRRR